MDNTIPISVVVFGKYIQHTEDEVWLGILKREYASKKFTLQGWYDLLATLKIR